MRRPFNHTDRVHVRAEVRFSPSRNYYQSEGPCRPLWDLSECTFVCLCTVARLSDRASDRSGFSRVWRHHPAFSNPHHDDDGPQLVQENYHPPPVVSLAMTCCVRNERAVCLNAHIYVRNESPLLAQDNRDVLIARSVGERDRLDITAWNGSGGSSWNWSRLFFFFLYGASRFALSTLANRRLKEGDFYCDGQRN